MGAAAPKRASHPFRSEAGAVMPFAPAWCPLFERLSTRMVQRQMLECDVHSALGWLEKRGDETMFKFLTPKSIRPPFARYSHGVEVPAGKRLVVCSGQIGIGPDDSVPEDVGAQAELCFDNIAAVLSEAGMTLANVVRINTFVSDRAFYMEVRDRLFSEPAPASTLLIVAGFSRPEFKIEVEVIAAG
jgi:enamine deaminase RidA (YjgF/YER057c/UK114 family)